MPPRSLLSALIGVVLLPGLVRAGDPVEAMRLINEAQKLEKEGRLADALEATRRAIELDPRQPHYYGIAGYLNWKLERYEEGIKDCQQAVGRAAGKDDAWFLTIGGENAYANLDLVPARTFFEKAWSRGEALGDNRATVRHRLSNLSPKRYEFEWALDPRQAANMKRKDGSILVSLPSTRWPFQKTLKMSVTGARAHKEEDFEANACLALTPDGNNIIRIRLTVAVEPYSYKDKLAQRVRNGALPAVTRTYLKESEWINPQSKVLQKIVAPLRRDDPLETVRAIHRYMRGRMRYISNDNLAAPADETAEVVLSRGQASCHGWSVAFVALCRSAGIPARMVAVLFAKDADRLGLHDIVEVYIPGARWVPFEPQPNGIIGMPGTQFIRLYHYPPGWKWNGRDATETHPVSVLTRMWQEFETKYNLR